MNWSARAAAAEDTVRARYLRRLAGLPGTRIGLAAAPATVVERAHLRWNYWWQAHLLDCLLDAQARAPSADRRRTVRALIRGVRLRNLGGWTNRYYDDIAWLGLALHRAGRTDGVAVILTALRLGWSEHGGGGIWWRRGDDFKNAPANAPAAILFARTGDVASAARIVDWITDALVDPATGLVADGLHVRPDGSVRGVERVAYTYCHGAYLGACTELAARDGHRRWSARAALTVDALRRDLADRDGVLVGGRGGDAGLFVGITARYLAQAALADPALADPALADPALRSRAGRLVLATAERAGAPARELSPRLSDWMLLEAAALLESVGR